MVSTDGHEADFLGDLLAFKVTGMNATIRGEAQQVRTEMVSGNPVELVWSCVPGKSYQVLATTNFYSPMAPIADAVVPADPSNAVTHWFDIAPDATNRFYRIQVLP